MTRILSYNINGIRAALKKGFGDWLKKTNADIVCLQEVKAHEEQLDLNIFKSLGYRIYWKPALKKGYSGVAILSKTEPLKVNYESGLTKYDEEGRILTAHYENFSVMSVYMPSGSSGEERQAFKMTFLDDFQEYIEELNKKYPNLIISGDYNICHQAIDIHNPVANKNSSGFLPEERAWLSTFLKSGFIDTFRHFNPEPNHYTWWSYRANAREKNLGWRIDYHMASNGLLDRLSRSTILSQAKHSDHCPILLELD
ncbi:exodeoxyribonuclease III [Fulvivirgaceae bacterium BMA10]|uniref:Exodeoxyribonuclease III n=1 Tax=Splendidivirga corallicola TaxID=3051826 RepID=A0ABT8KPB3_9BACT|nr:exodeoxyribonuclease III [Fulvivirgaceae bacterium BMA10]